MNLEKTYLALDLEKTYPAKSSASQSDIVKDKFVMLVYLVFFFGLDAAALNYHFPRFSFDHVHVMLLFLIMLFIQSRLIEHL